jgi:hypothetical protein
MTNHLARPCLCLVRGLITAADSVGNQEVSGIYVQSLSFQAR